MKASDIIKHIRFRKIQQDNGMIMHRADVLFTATCFTSDRHYSEMEQKEIEEQVKKDLTWKLLNHIYNDQRLEMANAIIELEKNSYPVSVEVKDLDAFHSARERLMKAAQFCAPDDYRKP